MIKIFWFFSTFTLIYTVIHFFYIPRDITNYFIPIFVTLTTLEGLRIIIVAIIKKKQNAWVIGKRRRVPLLGYISGMMESMDVYSEQAMGILTTSELADALDLSKEDPAIVARYGISEEKFQRDGAPKMIENFCIARRLVEAGARFVSLNYSRWDWHGGDGMNFPRSRQDYLAEMAKRLRRLCRQ